MERTDFDLIDRRRDLVVDDQVNHAVSLKIRDADRSDLTLLIEFFHRSPFAIDIAVGLMDEIQIYIIQLQAIEGVIKGFECVFVAIALNPKFGRDEQLFPGNAALLDAPANRFFVHIRSGSVDMGIASFNRIDHAAFAFGRVGDLKNAKAEDRDFNAIGGCRVCIIFSLSFVWLFGLLWHKQLGERERHQLPVASLLYIHLSHFKRIDDLIAANHGEQRDPV